MHITLHTHAAAITSLAFQCNLLCIITINNYNNKYKIQYLIFCKYKTI